MNPELARLSSGISVGEAMTRAEKWWGEFRGAVPETFTRMETVKGKVSRIQGGGGLLMRVKDVTKDQQVGNILKGSPWADLSMLERAKIVEVWHDEVFMYDEGRGTIQ